MRLVRTSTCLAYAERHAATRAPLALWVRRMRSETFATMAEVQAAFASAKALNGERMRFELGSHRLIAAFHFPSGVVYVKFIGTHAEYDRIDARTVAQH